MDYVIYRTRQKCVLLMKKISTKIFLSTLISGIAVGIVCLVANFVIFQKVSGNNINTIESTLREQFDLLVKSEVETAMSILSSYEKMYVSGLYTEEEAKKRAADLIRDLRYGNNYFWIDTSNGDNIVLFGSATEGTNRYNMQDTNGKYLIQDIINSGLKGGGYSDYYFPRAGETIPKPKRSYSAYFEKFDWVVGTGNYIDDIDDVISAKRE